jgi:hypothetical protein
MIEFESQNEDDLDCVAGLDLRYFSTFSDHKYINFYVFNGLISSLGIVGDCAIPAGQQKQYVDELIALDLDFAQNGTLDDVPGTNWTYNID